MRTQVASQVRFAKVIQTRLVSTSALSEGLESEFGGRGQGLSLRRNPRRAGITTPPPTQSGCVEKCPAPAGGEQPCFLLYALIMEEFLAVVIQALSLTHQLENCAQ